MSTTSEQVLGVLKGMFPSPVQLHEPYFGGREWEYVKECLDTGWVSSVGKFVDRFEADVAAFTGVKRAVAVVNGTAALQVCLQLAGVRPGDEVLIPSLTFIATANAVSYCGAVPHFIDSSEESLGVCPRKLADYLPDVIERRSDGFSWNRRSGRRIAACVPMHTFGHPVDLDPLMEVCNRYRIAVVEDAAESLGSYYKGTHTGNRGLISALSFNGNKVITTGGGGAILTNDEHLGKLAKHITTTARVPHPWRIEHDQVGYNYRMPNINAALGCAQLEQLPAFLAQKRALAMRYAESFKGVPGVRLFIEPSYAKSNYWLNVLLLGTGNEEQRDAILGATNDSKIMTRPAWTLLNHLPMYRNSPAMDLSVAESLERRLVNIPSSAICGREGNA